MPTLVFITFTLLRLHSRQPFRDFVWVRLGPIVCQKELKPFALEMISFSFSHKTLGSKQTRSAPFQRHASLASGGGTG